MARIPSQPQIAPEPRAGVTTGIIVGGIDGAAKAAAQGGASWEKLSMRELGQARLGPVSKTPQ